MNKHVHQGHFARKRFGQNFLHDDYTIDSIVSAIAPKAQDNLIEIGPGLGSLTVPLSKRTDHLTVIEIDRDLAARLKENADLKNRINVIESDVMKVDFRQLLNNEAETLRVVGNLPYNISTPLLFYLFQFRPYISDMYFMLQKEVVSRLVATPNHKSYGRLAVIAQYYCQIIPVLEVPPSAFTPAPKVNSAVVQLIPHNSLPYSADNVKLLGQITRLAFNQRRKTLRNSLRALFSEEQLASLDIDANKRAENLAVSQYVQLANFYSRKRQN